MARKPVKRHTRNYQFRDDHPIDQHVDSILDYWKGDRREITTLRKAVALYYALEQGDFGALLEAFPQYKSQVSGGGGGGFDTDKLATEIAERVAMLNGSQYQMQPPAPAPTGKLLGGGKVLSAPIEDDEPLPDIVTRKDSGAGLKSCNNFMQGLMSLQ